MEKLNQDGLHRVIRSISLQNDCDIENYDKDDYSTDIKAIWQKAITLSNIQLKNLQDSINKILANDKYIESWQLQQNNFPNASNNETFSDASEYLLLRLPNDLIIETASFLNEKEIFIIERCCRLLYKMINNTSYLKKSNNFKTFTLTEKELKQMSEPACSFFKYAKADRLIIDNMSKIKVDSPMEVINNLVTTVRDMWDKAEKQWIKEGWYKSIFTSIRTLKINADAMFLLDKLPIEIMFNPQISDLETIEELNYYWYRNNIIHLQNIMQQFVEKYLNFKKKLNQQQLQQGEELSIKKLRSVRHFNGRRFEVNALKEIEATHVIMDSMMLDLNDNFTMEVLTCENDVEFISKWRDISINNYDDDGCINCISGNIQTLRLTRFRRESNCDLCNNQNLIESFQLDKSVKNLLIDLTLENNISTKWKDAIECIIKKQYYHNLENVNLLLGTTTMKDVEWIFKVLKNHQGLLKYNFKNLNIALIYYLKSMYRIYYTTNRNSNYIVQPPCKDNF